MAALDWSECAAVESVPGKVSGAWVFKGTRTPVAIVFDNLEDRMTIDEVVEQFPVTREQIKTVLEFAARSLDAPLPGRWCGFSSTAAEEQPFSNRIRAELLDFSRIGRYGSPSGTVA